MLRLLVETQAKREMKAREMVTSERQAVAARAKQAAEARSTSELLKAKADDDDAKLQTELKQKLEEDRVNSQREMMAAREQRWQEEIARRKVNEEEEAAKRKAGEEVSIAILQSELQLASLLNCLACHRRLPNAKQTNRRTWRALPNSTRQSLSHSLPCLPPPNLQTTPSALKLCSLESS